jgi:hypothetical protein
MEDSAFVVSMKGSERTLEELISLFSTFFLSLDSCLYFFL